MIVAVTPNKPNTFFQHFGSCMLTGNVVSATSLIHHIKDEQAKKQNHSIHHAQWL